MKTPEGNIVYIVNSVELIMLFILKYVQTQLGHVRNETFLTGPFCLLALKVLF